MKGISTIVVALIAILFASYTFGQTKGDFRTATPLAGGNWYDASSWQTYDGTNWVAASTTPTGSENITIQTGDSVVCNFPVVITGHLTNFGKINDSGQLTISKGGIYEHAYSGGSVPTATWDDGSTILFSGVTSTNPSNANQDFYNVIWNCPNQTFNANLGWNGNTIHGDITVISTGSGRWQMTAPSASVPSVSVTINGNIYVKGGAFSSNGTSTSNSTVVINTLGNIFVTGGNFSVSRGSQGGTGTTSWYITGNLSMENATTQNSNSTGAKFIFNGKSDTLTLGSGNTLTALPIEVASGTTLNMGMSQLAGSGIFTVDSGATLATANLALDSCFASTMTGVVTLSSKANYTFNGAVAQATGTRLPTTVANLTINNPAGVVLTQATTINDTLFLMNGVFDNTIPFVQGTNFKLITEKGSLKNPITGIDEAKIQPLSFKVEQNYPNPFNPTTTINYSLKSAGVVSIKIYNVLGREVRTLVNEQKPSGNYSVVWNGRDNSGYSLPSGTYFYRYSAGDVTQVKKMILLK
jgi:phage baseplate assembly protein gpV